MERREGYGVCGRGCDDQFKGSQNHCTICHQTFATESGGDSHRYGDYNASADSPAGRKCRSEDEMRANGMWQKPNGAATLVWHGRYRVKRPGSKPHNRRQVWWVR